MSTAKRDLEGVEGSSGERPGPCSGYTRSVTESPSPDSGTGAVDWRSFSSAWKPSGLEQRDEREASADVNWRQFSRDSSPAWFTGGQTGSSNNALQSDWFLGEMYKQQEEALETGKNPYEREDFTGVALYDGKQGKNEFKLGDTWVEGKKTGNIFDDYEQADANAIMAQFMLDPDAQARTFEKANGDQDALFAELRKVADGFASDVENFKSGAAFDKEVNKNLAEMGLGENTAIVGGAAAAGAATGALLGTAGGIFAPITSSAGAIVGGLVGGVGALLNLDSLRDNWARADAEASMVEGSDFTANLRRASAFMEAGSANVSSIGNLVTGLTAAGVEGGEFNPFDDQTAMERAAAAGSTGDANWLRAGSIVGTVGDLSTLALGNVSSLAKLPGGALDAAQGMSAGARATSAVAKAASYPTTFQLGIGGMVAGDAADILEGTTFNPETGSYQQLSTTQRMALAGAMGLNIVQSRLPLGLGTSLERGMKVANEATGLGKVVDNVLSKVVDSNTALGRTIAAQRSATSRVKNGGVTYFLDDAGNAISSRLNVGVFAPSEALQGLAAGGLALRAAALGKGLGITSQSLYRASQALANNSRMRSVWIQASTEMTEEAVEEFYRGYAMGDPSLEDIAWAAAGGALGGAAMAAPFAALARTQAQEKWAGLQALSEVTGVELPVTEEQFMKGTDQERLAVWKQVKDATGSLTDLAASDALAELVVTDAALGSTTLARAQRQAALVLEEKARNNGVPYSSTATKVSLNPDPDAEGYHVVSGPTKIIQDYEKWLGVVSAAEAKAGTPGGPMTQALTQILETLKQSHLSLLQAARTLEGNEDQVRAARAALVATFSRDFNRVLQDAWDGKSGDEAAQAVGMLHRRYPVDNPNSFFLTLGQVSENTVLPELSGEPVGIHLVPSAVLSGLTMDFDGDFDTLMDVVLEKQAWINRRSGATYNAGPGEGGGVDIMSTPYQETALDQAALVKLAGTKKERKAYNAVLDTFEDKIVALLSNGSEMVVSRSFLEEHLFAPLRTGTPSKSLFEDFWVALGASPYGAALGDRGAETLTNHFFRLHREFVLLSRDILTVALQRLTRTRKQRASLEADEALPPLTDSLEQNESVGAIAPSASPAGDKTVYTRQAEYFRREGFLHYNQLTAGTLQSLFGTSELSDLYLQDLFVNSGDILGAAESAFNRDVVERTALAALERVRDELNRDLGRNDVPWTLVDLAYYKPEGSPETFLQVALKSAVQHEARKYPNADAEAVQAKFARFRNLDWASAALVVLGGESIDTLLPYHSAAQLGLAGTLGGVASEFALTGDALREPVRQDLEAHPDWRSGRWSDDGATVEDRQGGPTGPRILGQIILAEGRKLSLNKDTFLAHSSHGLGKDDAGIDAQLRAIQPQLRAYLNRALRTLPGAVQARGLRASDGLTADVVYALLDTDTRLAERLVAALPVEVTAQLWDSNTGQFTKGFLNFLTSEDVDAGITSLWREGILAQLLALQQPGAENKYPTDRVVQLLAQLRAMGETHPYFVKAYNAVIEAKTPQAAISQLNQFYPNFAPQLVWLRDERFLAPGAETGGYSLSISSKPLKEALDDLSTTLAQLDKSLSERAAIDDRSDQVAMMARDELQSGKPGTAVRAIEERLAWLRTVKPLLGPRARLQSIVYSGLARGRGYNKGATDTGFEALGAFIAGAQPMVFGVGDAQVAGDQAAYSEYDLHLHPEVLLHEGRFMTADGGFINWPGLTPELVVEMYSKPLYKPLLDSILDPAIYDTDAVIGTGVSRQVFSVAPGGTPRGLGGLLPVDGIGGSKAHLAHLGNTYEGRVLATAMADAETGTNEWHRYAIMYYHNLLSQESGGTVSEARMETLAQEAMEVTGRLVQTISSLEEEQFKIFKETLQAELSRSDDPLTAELVAAAREQLALNKETLSLGYPEEVIDLLAEELDADIEGRSLAQAIYQAYVPQDGELFSAEQKMQMQEKLLRYGGLQASNINKNSAELLRIMDLVGDGSTLATLPSEKSWNILANALFNHEIAGLLDLGSTGTSQGLTATKKLIQGEHGDVADPTRSYLVQRILDDHRGMTSAARGISNPVNRSSRGGKQAARQVLTTLFGKDGKKLEKHSSITVGRIIAALDAETTAAATSGIATGGVVPEQFWLPSVATRYDWTVQPSVPPRQVTLSLDDLAGTVFNEQENRFEEDPQSLYRVRVDDTGKPFMVGDLAGRVYTDVSISFKKDGATQTVALRDLFGATTVFPLARAFPRDASNESWFHTSPALLVAALRQGQAPGGPLDGATSVTVAASFFHPADAPAGETNAYVYQGVYNMGGRTQESPLASLMEVNGLVRATSRTSLDALKTSTPALYNAEIQAGASKAITSIINGSGNHDYRLLFSTLVSNHMQASKAFAGQSYPAEYIHVVENLYKLEALVRVRHGESVEIFSLSEMLAVAPGEWPASASKVLRDGGVTTKEDIVFLPTDMQNLYFDRAGTDWNGTWNQDTLRELFPGLFNAARAELPPLEALGRSAFVAQRASSQASLYSTNSYRDRRQSREALRARHEKRARADKVRLNQPEAFEALQKASKAALRRANLSLSTPAQVFSSIFDAVHEGLKKDLVIPPRKFAVPVADQELVDDSVSMDSTRLAWNLVGTPSARGSRVDVTLEQLVAEVGDHSIGPAPLDLVLFDAGKLVPEVDAETQVLEAYRVAKQVVDAGFELQLSDSTQQGLAGAVRQRLALDGYVMGKTISQPDNLRALTSDERALSSQLNRVNVLTDQNMVLVLGTDQLPVFEQAGIIQKSKSASSLGAFVGSQLVSLGATPGASLADPLDSSQSGKQALAVFEALQQEMARISTATALGKTAETPLIDHLVEQGFLGSKKITAESREQARESLLASLRKLDQYDPDTLLPRLEADALSEYKMEEGDIFFLVKGNGNVILWRAGHEPIPGDGGNTSALGKQLRTKIESTSVTRGVAINGHSLQQGISFRQGIVSRLRRNGPTSLDARVRIPLNEVFTKLLLNVFKTTTISEPDSLSFALPENESRFHIIWGDNADIDGKQYSENRLGTLDGSSAVLGHSFVESIVKAFSLYTDAEWASIQESYSRGEVEGYQAALAAAREAVEKRARFMRDERGLAGVTPESVQRDLSRMAKVGPSLGKVFSDLLGFDRLGDDANLIAHQQIAAAIVLNAAIPGTSVEHLLTSNGLARSSTTRQGLHVLGAFFDDRPKTDPIKQILVRQQKLRLQSFLPFAELTDDGHRVQVTVRDKATGEPRVLTASLGLGRADVDADSAPVVQQQSGERTTRQGLSRNQEATAWLVGAGSSPASMVDFSSLPRRITPPATARDLLAPLASVDLPPLPVPRSPHENLIRDVEDGIRAESAVDLSFEEWSDRDKAQYLKDRKKFADTYLNGREKYVDHMVRLLLWRRHVKDSTFGDIRYGWVSAQEAFKALSYFQAQVKQGRFPLYDAPTGAMDANIVFHMAEQAWKNRQAGKQSFVPDNDLTVLVMKDGSPKPVKAKMPAKPPADATWEQFLQYYMDVALAELYVTKRESYDEITASAYLHTYERYYADDLNGASLESTLPTEMNIFDPNLEQFVAALDKKKLQDIANDPLISEEFREGFFQNLALDYTVSSEYNHSIPEKVLRQVKTRRKAWDSGVRVLARDLNGLDFTRDGVSLRSRDKHRAATLAHSIVQASILGRVANPILLIGATFEQAVRLTTQSLADFLTGPTASSLPGGLALLRDASEAFLDNKGVHLLQEELFDDSPYVRPGGSRRLNTAIRKTLRWQSWTRSRRSVANTFVQSVARSVLAAPGEFGGLTLESAMRILETDPVRFKESYPDLWAMGLSAAADAYGMRQVGASYLLNRGLSALGDSHPAVSAVTDLVIRGPLAFQGYFTNVLVNMTGMQGVQAVVDTGIALLLGRSQSAKRQQLGKDILNQAQIEVDFANLVVRGGITHAGLFVLAMMARGFLGNDDEWERREQLEEQGIFGLAWDIRKVENDWRNAEALYLEGTPLEFLSGLFTTGSDENGDPVSPFVPAWYMKQITSPFLGLAKFSRTGNFLDIIDGYADALGSMPLANDLITAFSGITQTNALLFQRSVDAASGDTVSDEDLARSYHWMTKVFMNYERIYAEWGFLNTLYTGLDDYQRDPFARADLDADGNIQSDKLGQSMETTLTNQRLNDAGETYDGTAGYSGEAGIRRAYGSQRLGMALFNTGFSVFTGFDLSNLRWNMPVRELKIQKQEIETVEDATALVLSVWDEKAGHEVLNEEGAAALARSLHAGVIKPDSPVLQNVYLTPEMRMAVSEKLLEELIVRGMEDGLTKEEATYNANDLFYGDPDREYIEPLYDVIWSRNKFEDAIPYSPVSTYQYLNTTFVEGPDGKLWATGLERGLMSPNLAGVAPMQRFSGAGTTENGFNSNLTVDERLNSTDRVGNVNLGIRSMTKKDETQDTVRDEDIIASLDKVADRILDIPAAGGNGGGGGYGGGGGGGGYARNTYLPYLPNSRSPYWDNITTIYGNTPNIRRVSIRRERFSSERGRLLQWQ